MNTGKTVVGMLFKLEGSETEKKVAKKSSKTLGDLKEQLNKLSKILSEKVEAKKKESI